MTEAALGSLPMKFCSTIRSTARQLLVKEVQDVVAMVLHAIIEPRCSSTFDAQQSTCNRQGTEQRCPPL
jgi:hypothetical protein